MTDKIDVTAILNHRTWGTTAPAPKVSLTTARAASEHVALDTLADENRALRVATLLAGLVGWRLVRGYYEPGPDACECLGFLDPDGDVA